MALRKFALNMAALTATRMLQTVSAFLAIPILARLLGPADFGLVAMAGAFVMFTMAISDAGLGQTLVRVPAREREVWSSAFWFLTLIGLALALVLALISFPAAWLLREPRLTAVILALAPVPLAQACLAALIADLQQREKLRHLATAELFGSLAGALAAIGLALFGAGVWALVAQQLAYWAMKGAIIVSASAFRPDLTFRLSALGQHISFGRDTALLGLVGFFARQLDPLVIGRLLGAAPVGAYSVAGRIASLPMQFISVPLQSALFTRMVMLRDDRAATRDLLLVAAWFVSAIVFPGMAVAAAASAAYFELFLTEKWLPAAPIFTILAPAMAFQAVMIICGTMLLAIGATGRRLRLNVEFMIPWLIILPISAMYGVTAVALAYTASYALISIRTYPLYLEPVGCGAGEFFKALTAPILVALAAALAHVGARTFWPMGAALEVLVSVVVLACAYGVLAYAEREKVGERIAILRGVLSAKNQYEAPE